MQKYFPIFLLTAATPLAVASGATSEPSENISTCSTQKYPRTCYTSPECKCRYCLGPAVAQSNCPVRPLTCGGDYEVTLAGFYWKGYQDGLEYAVDNAVSISAGQTIFSQEANNVVDSRYQTPHFKWRFGGKVGLAYYSPCDGWDFGILWTGFDAKARSHIEAEEGDNHILLPLWSVYNGALGAPIFARDIQTHWKLNLNLVDIELGREFWTSKYLTFRPQIGLRLAWLDQRFKIEHKGGSWTSVLPVASADNEVNLRNYFRGVGVRAGFDLNWNLGCGFSLYNNFATSIVYGRFKVDHKEENRQVVSPFDTEVLLESESRFRASRGMLDLELGIKWYTLFCNCQYVFTAMFGWEQHLFFNQNQMWRVERKFVPDIVPGIAILNNTGENVFQQGNGCLSTQGWTLTFKFDF